MWRCIKSRGYLLLALFGGVCIVASSIASAATKVQTSICGDFLEPTIAAPVTGFITKNSSIIVTGTAEPLMSLAILDATTAVAVTLVASDGTYSVSVPLAEGINSFTAHEVNECGTVKDSSVVMVQRKVDKLPVLNENNPLSSQPSVPVIAELSSPSRALRRPFVSEPATEGYKTPTINKPADHSTYTSGRIWVAGSAEPGSIITIYLDDISVARVVASVRGDYGVIIELHAGSNTLRVRSEKDGKTAASHSITVFLSNQPAKLESSTPIGAAVVVTIATLAVIILSATGFMWMLKGIQQKGGR